MRAVAHIVEEDHAEVGFGAERFGQVSTVEILMAAGLQQHGATIVIRVLFEPGNAFDNRLAGNLGKTLRDQAKGFAAGVQFDCG